MSIRMNDEITTIIMIIMGKKFLSQYPMIFAKAAKDQAKYESIGTALSLLDKFLEGENYVAGKNITLADLSIVTTVSTIEVIYVLYLLDKSFKPNNL